MMRFKPQVLIGVLAVIGLMIFLFFNLIDTNQTTIKTKIKNDETRFDFIPSICKNSYEPCPNVGRETRELSAILNNALQDNGRLTCESSTNQVSERGGWCAKISGANSPQHAFDQQLATEFSRFLKGKRVASFGDGPGLYQKFISGLEEVLTYDAFDGAPYCEETTDGRVKHLDLSAPVYHLSMYDWVISLEVAEHIPKEFEQIFVDNLTRHAKEGIILSWAKIGQEGHSHVNNQAFEYVKEQMEKRGFRHDEVYSKKLREIATLDWLKKTLNIYFRVKPYNGES